MSAIERYLQNNARYAGGFSKASLKAPPARRTAIVTCMDARLETGALLGLEEGDAHVIRNAGGVVTEDVIRSLVVSQVLLGTREVMVIQHTDCGMTKFTEAEVKDAIQQATGERPAFAMGTFPDLEEEIRQSVARIVASPFVAYKDAIRGFVYAVETGRLREVK